MPDGVTLPAAIAPQPFEAEIFGAPVWRLSPEAAGDAPGISALRAATGWR